jgi:hypothetical protein
MNPRINRLLVVAAFFLAASPAFAQVERVVVEAEGISKTCSPGLEAALKSMDSVYQYAISVPKQMFTVTYYSGEKFDPKKLRWAADKGEAEVTKLHVSATGKVEQSGDHQVFVSGDDRFDLVSNSPLPTGVEVGIMGVVDDTKSPIQLQPDDFKVLTDADAPQAEPKPEAKSEADPEAKPEPQPESKE